MLRTYLSCEIIETPISLVFWVGTVETDEILSAIQVYNVREGGFTNLINAFGNLNWGPLLLCPDLSSDIPETGVEK